MNCYFDLTHITIDHLVHLVVVIVFSSIVLAHGAMVAIKRLTLFAGVADGTRERLHDLVGE